MSINPNPDRPATVPPPMSRAAKAEALLLRFAAEAHRRKWTYDRGLDGDGVPVKSEAFDALHRLGEEMRVALEELRRTPAAVSVVPPATNQTAPVDRAAVLREAAADVMAYCPDHGDRETARIACHCEIADELRRLAAEAPHTAAPDDGAEQIAKVSRWVTSEVVSAKTEFGDGYRAAQRDILDLINGRFNYAPRPAVVAQPGKEAS